MERSAARGRSTTSRERREFFTATRSREHVEFVSAADREFVAAGCEFERRR